MSEIADEAAPDNVIPSELAPLLIAAEWLENDLHEMELCCELGESGKDRYEQLRTRVVEEMEEFVQLRSSLPSWDREQQLHRAWKEWCRKRASEKHPDDLDTTPPAAEPETPAEQACTDDAESSLYSLQSSGFDLFYATHDMVLCRELGGEAARKHYELCAQTVQRLLGHAPPTWEVACAAHAEAEAMFREIVEATKQEKCP